MDYSIDIVSNVSEIAGSIPTSPLTIILFGGDRLTCVDMAAIAHAKGRVFGLATLALHGEMGDGKPTLVGLWVHPAARVSYRRQKGEVLPESIGVLLMDEIIGYMEDQGIEFPLRVEVLTVAGDRFFKKLHYTSGTLELVRSDMLVTLPESGELPGLLDL